MIIGLFTSASAFNNETKPNHLTICETENVLKQLSYINDATINHLRSGIISIYFTLPSELNAIDARQESQIKDIVAESLNLSRDLLELRCITGSSTIIQRITSECVSKELTDIAYMDLAKASPEMKVEILNARRIIINNTEWVPDSGDGWVENVETGEIIRRIPAFSEIFPDWDPPNTSLYN